MGILPDRDCPKCGAKDSLIICAFTGAVNCSECWAVVRYLRRDEKREFNRRMAKLLDELEEGVDGYRHRD